MSSILITIIAAVVVVGFFALAMSLTYIFKGHHIESEISTNPNMQKMGIKCAVQETREDMGLTDCDTGNICSGNCAGCDWCYTIIDGIGMWKYSANSCGIVDFNYSTIWSDRC